MRLLLKNSKILKSVFSVTFVIVLTFVFTITSFAVNNSHFEYVTSIDLYSDTHYSGVASDFDDIHWSKQGTDTIIYNSGGSYKVPIVYYSPEYWTAGQTYRIEFVFGPSSIDGMAIALSTTPNLTDGEQTYITSDCPAKSNKSYNYSFVYDGQPYLIFTFIMKSHKSCLISNIDVFTYNPNAVVESQNQQIIEQNSELHSNLFGQTEPVEDITDVDLSKQDSIIKDFFSTMSSNLAFDLTLGVKGFAYYFNFIFDKLKTDWNGKIILQLLNFSLITSVIVLIVGILRDNRQSSSGGYYDRRSHTFYWYNDKKHNKNKKG